MVLERLARGFALLAFFEPAKLQRVMLAAGADVVDEQIIVGDLVAALGMVRPSLVAVRHPKSQRLDTKSPIFTMPFERLQKSN